MCFKRQALTQYGRGTDLHSQRYQASVIAHSIVSAHILLPQGLVWHAAMKAKGEVARMAVLYLRCRSIAAPVSLAMFVATGSFRGFKDTKYALLPIPVFAVALTNSLYSRSFVLVFVVACINCCS